MLMVENVVPNYWFSSNVVSGGQPGIVVRITMAACDLGTEKREFEDAILKHLKSLYYTAFHLTRNKANAEDLTQETFLKALNSYQSFRRGTNAFAWLSRIMLNTFINGYHRSKREVNWNFAEKWNGDGEYMGIFYEPSFTPDEREILGDWVDDEIMEALNRLPVKFRNAVVMFDLQGHTYQEIAETHNCAVGTVKSRLFRGRHILRRILRNYAARRGFKNRNGSKRAMGLPTIQDRN